MENRRDFIKNSAMAVMALSIPGCSSRYANGGSMIHDTGVNSMNERLRKIQGSPNYNGKKFVNPVNTNAGMVPGTAFDTMRQWIAGDEVRVPKFALPVKHPTPSFFASEPNDGLRVTWMGHSSLLIEIDGRKILTDPIWSKRCSPFSMVGPARFHPPPLSIKSLPALDAVLISHDHFDHLDKATILALAETEAHFYLPLGVGEYLESWGIPADRFTEKDWWEIESLGSDDFTLMATPARHFSGRVTLSGNPTLWTSWTILGPRHRVFFSGDTGWMPVFEKIGNRFGPFDMTMIEIGAYHENWGDIHLGPRQAVDVHLALKGRILLPVHWGTFNLGLHAWNEPIEQLISCASLKSANFVAPQPGQSVSPARLPDLSKWWLKRSA